LSEIARISQNCQGRLRGRYAIFNPWDLDGGSWRDDLAQLAGKLATESDDDVPEDSLQHMAVLTAVCMGLLRSGASLTGGAPEDILAARTWRSVYTVNLLIPPLLPRAHVLSQSELESLRQLAADDDPLAHIQAELAVIAWDIENDDGCIGSPGRSPTPFPWPAASPPCSRNTSTPRWYQPAPPVAVPSSPGGVLTSSWPVHPPAMPGASTASPNRRPPNRVWPAARRTSVGMVGRPVRLGLLPLKTAQGLLANAGDRPHLPATKAHCPNLRSRPSRAPPFELTAAATGRCRT
jgi:hypothetical protein